MRALLPLLAALLLLAAPLRAQEGFDGAVAGLAGGFGAQAEAVDRLGGRIDVSRSDLGGARFAVRLPAGPGPSGAGRADAVVGAP